MDGYALIEWSFLLWMIVFGWMRLEVGGWRLQDGGYFLLCGLGLMAGYESVESSRSSSYVKLSSGHVHHPVMSHVKSRVALRFCMCVTHQSDDWRHY